MSSVAILAWVAIHISFWMIHTKAPPSPRQQLRWSLRGPLTSRTVVWAGTLAVPLQLTVEIEATFLDRTSLHFICREAHDDT